MTDVPSKQTAAEKREILSRWRLVLGKYAQPKMPQCLSENQEQMADALERLYSREYAGRGVRSDPKLGPGSLDASQLNVPKWLDDVRELFPKQTVERITNHALDRYGMTEVLEDAETLAACEPSVELLSAVLSLKGRMSDRVLQEARKLIRRVVEDVRKKIEQKIRAAMSGQLNRFRQSRIPIARNFDARGTIRRNLKNWDPKTKRIIVDDPRFFSRVRRHIPWEIILCVDQSGSMADSVIHSAVTAAILAALPMLRVQLVVFDTSVVDLSEHVTDPIEVLMGVQLGGGTNIGQALHYCESKVTQPGRTVLVLVSDFCEGADPKRMFASVKRLKEGGVKLLGLAALTQDANPWYDVPTAERLSTLGMEIAALTPMQLAEWLQGVMNQ